MLELQLLSFNSTIAYTIDLNMHNYKASESSQTELTFEAAHYNQKKAMVVTMENGTQTPPLRRRSARFWRLMLAVQRFEEVFKLLVGFLLFVGFLALLSWMVKKGVERSL